MLYAWSTVTEKLPEILNVSTCVTDKYHITIGAVKCKVVKKMQGKSAIKLHGRVLEEAPTYK